MDSSVDLKYQDHLYAKTLKDEPEWDSHFMFQVHVAACVLYIIGFFLNGYILLLIARYKPLPVLMNWALGNQLFCNGVRCFFHGIYSGVKASQFSPPDYNPQQSIYFRTRTECAISTGINVFSGFGPLWSLSLLAFTVALNYSPLTSLKKWFTPFRFMEIRVGMFILDLIVLSLMTQSLMKNNDWFTTYCTWQLMVRPRETANKWFVGYHSFMISTVVLFGIAAIVFRIIYLKNKMSKPDYKHPARPEKIRRMCCTFIGGGSMAALFIVARIAYLGGGFHFWVGTETLTYPIMFIIMPLIFICSSNKLRAALLRGFGIDSSPNPPLSTIKIAPVPDVVPALKQKVENNNGIKTEQSDEKDNKVNLEMNMAQIKDEML